MNSKCESNEKIDCLIRFALDECATETVKMLDETDTMGVVCPPEVDQRVRQLIWNKG